MAKKITFSKDLDGIKLRAINIVEGAVKSTLGPSGRFVLLDQSYGAPKMTKDGVSIAKSIELQDAEENAIASFFKTAATHTVDEAGDGTTTSIVLAASVFKAALKGISFGADKVAIKKGIEHAAKIALQEIEKLNVVIADDFEKTE